MLFVLIAQQRVGDRPGRIEPGAVKQRAKPYPLLTNPRAHARAYIRARGRPKESVKGSDLFKRLSHSIHLYLWAATKPKLSSAVIAIEIVAV